MPLGQLLSRLSQQRILVVGDLILDEYIVGESSRLSPEAPVPIVQFSGLRAVPGGAANAAANVAALGGHVTAIGLLGEDQAGRELARLCETAAVRIVPVADGRPTTRKVRVTERQHQLLRLDYEHVAYIGRDAEERILEVFAREVEDTDLVVISDYAKGLITSTLCPKLITMAHSTGKQVIIDPRPQHGPSYMDCDYLTPNWKESQGLLGWTETAFTDEVIDRTGALISHRFHCNVLLTLGAKGIAFFGKDEHARFLVPAVAREIFDVSGAGDTVVAVFALAKAAGCDDHDAVSLANRAAGIVVAKRGTSTVTPEELLASDDFEARLLRRDDLRGLSCLLKARGKRVVTVNGSFDLLHAGHLYFLKEAKQQGDVLIVGLNSDSSIRSHKGPTRPVVPEAQRAEMLLALRLVDYVHVFEEPVPMPFLEAVQPDVHVNGSEYGEACIEAAIVRRSGGRLHIVERLEGLSTSAVLARI